MTHRTLFPTLPGTARLWIYAAERPLTEHEQHTLRQELDPFMAEWTSHERPVEGAATMLHDRFLLVAAAIPGGDISGCGIDKLTRVTEGTARAMGFRWATPLSIFYRDADGVVQRCARPAFRELAGAGAVTAQTPVFDLGLTTLEDLRAGRFEKPAGASWHARAFGLLTEPAAP